MYWINVCGFKSHLDIPISLRRHWNGSFRGRNSEVMDTTFWGRNGNVTLRRNGELDSLVGMMVPGFGHIHLGHGCFLAMARMTGPFLVLQEIELVKNTGMNFNVVNVDVKTVDKSWTELDAVQFCPTFIQPSRLEGISYLWTVTS